MKYALLAPFLLIVCCVAQVRATAPTAVIRGTLAALDKQGLIRADDVDGSKTWSEEISSEHLSSDASRKVYLVQFQSRRGETIRAIAKWDISPMPEQSGLVVYVISEILQPDGKPTPPRQR